MILFLWYVQIIYLLFVCFGICLQYLDVEYFSHYLSYTSVYSLGTEVVKPYTPVLPSLPLDFQESPHQDGVHVYLMIKIYSHGLFTQALDHLQIGKYVVGVVFGFATIALFLKIHCLSIVVFLLFPYLVRTSLKFLNLILHSLNVKACPDCNQTLSITESSLLSEVCKLYHTSQLMVLVSYALTTSYTFA